MLPSRSLHLTMRTYDSSMRAGVSLPSFKQSQSFSPRCALPQQESDFAFFKKHPLWDHRCVFNHSAASPIPSRRKDRKPLSCVSRVRFLGSLSLVMREAKQLREATSSE